MSKRSAPPIDLVLSKAPDLLEESRVVSKLRPLLNLDRNRLQSQDDVRQLMETLVYTAITHILAGKEGWRPTVEQVERVEKAVSGDARKLADEIWKTANAAANDIEARRKHPFR